MKEVPFLSRMVYKGVRGWTQGGASLYKTFLSTPFPGCGAATPTPCAEGQQIPCNPSFPFSNKD